MDIEIVALALEHADRLAEIERLCFPTAVPDEWTDAECIRVQYETFPEGCVVAIDRDADDLAVGFGSGCFVDFDFNTPQHHINDVVGEWGSNKHDPQGAWYYGTDIAVVPEYRGNGIGGALYDARKDLIKRYNRRGLVAGGAIPGFASHMHTMTASEYVYKVRHGDLHDRTLSMQLANGFQVLGTIANYWGDPAVDNWASLIVWHNPDYVAAPATETGEAEIESSQRTTNMLSVILPVFTAARIGARRTFQPERRTPQPV